MELIRCGDQVAIMPNTFAPVTDVLDIVSVVHAGEVYVLLADGRMYATIGGKSFSKGAVTYIVPATDQHHEALRQHELQKAVG